LVFLLFDFDTRPGARERNNCRNPINRQNNAMLRLTFWQPLQQYAVVRHWLQYRLAPLVPQAAQAPVVVDAALLALPPSPAPPAAIAAALPPLWVFDTGFASAWAFRKAAASAAGASWAPVGLKRRSVKAARASGGIAANISRRVAASFSSSSSSVVAAAAVVTSLAPFSEPAGGGVSSSTDNFLPAAAASASSSTG
jgi:hypothetical protein